MSETAVEEVSEEQVLKLVDRLRSADTSLSPVGAAVIAAVHLGIASDSRTFSRIFGIAHALVLREVTELAEERLLDVVDRNLRTQRTAFALTDTSQALLLRVT